MGFGQLATRMGLGNFRSLVNRFVDSLSSMGWFKKTLGYVLYALIMTGIFLIVLFPAEDARKYLEASLAGKTGMNFSIKGARLALPVGLRFENIDMTTANPADGYVFKATNCLIKPTPGMLSQRRPVFSVSCTAYGGRVDGTIGLSNFKMSGPAKVNVAFSKLHYADNVWMKKWSAKNVRGEMNATLACVTTGSFLNSSGQGTVSITGAQMPLRNSFFETKAIPLDEVKGSLELNQQKLKVANVDFRGAILNGKASGHILLEKDLPQSRLELDITARPSGKLAKSDKNLSEALALLAKKNGKKDVSILIRGTWNAPKTDVGGLGTEQITSAGKRVAADTDASEEEIKDDQG